MIRIEALSYQTRGRSERKLLDGIDCVIPSGELTVVLGPNGAGKSTLLRILSGERAPHAGNVLVDGVGLDMLKPKQLALKRAVLGQQYTVDLPFNCEEVVMMGRYPHYTDRPSALDHKVVAKALKTTESEHLAQRAYNTLSGGEQQRVQLSRVLAQLENGADPGGKDEGSLGEKYLLLDEPTASLDYLHQQLCLQRVKELCRRGLTVVMVLHDLNLAAQVADRLLVLKGGRLVAEGPPRELLGVGLIREVYGLETKLFYPEPDGVPVVITNLSTC